MARRIRKGRGTAAPWTIDRTIEQRDPELAQFRANRIDGIDLDRQRAPEPGAATADGSTS